MDPGRWKEIQATFDQLVELDVAERSNRLAMLGSTDPELRAAVESMLAADAVADAQLASFESSLAFLSTPDLFGFSGRTIAHFRVQEPIGSGGMGVVYRAEDTRLGRRVALKFLLPLYSLDAKAKARFIREAKAGAALDHPNLCSIHEVGTTDEGQLFLAMPLYAGETLKTRLEREHTLPVGKALAIARQVTEGLKSAHAAGIVHRDLKPGNVMLVPDGGVKILDFGLAKAVDQSVTETGGRFGTVSYMAPEQVRGTGADERSDLWALGVLLYEMVTGCKPFGCAEEIAVAHAIIHDDPTPPSVVRADVPPVLEDVVLRLLQKDPRGRPQSAAELLYELARTGEVVPWLRQRWRRAQRSLRTDRRWFGAAAASIAVAVLVYAGAPSVRPPAAAPSPARSVIAVLPFQNLSTQEPQGYFARGLHEEILTQLYRVPAIKVIGRASLTGYGGPNLPTLRQIATELGAGSIVQGSVQVVGKRVRVNIELWDPSADAVLWSQHYDRTVEDAFALESDIAQQIVATVGAALSVDRQSFAAMSTTKARAYLLYLEGREYGRRGGDLQKDFETEEQRYEQALALDPEFAAAHAELSMVHGIIFWYRYDPSPARAARQRSEAEAALRLAPNLPQAHVAMGDVHYYQSEWQPAMDEYQRALDLQPNDAELLAKVCAVHRRLGHWDDALAIFERIAEIDPRGVQALWDLGGQTYRSVHRHGDEVRMLDRTLSLVPDLDEIKIERGWAFVRWRGELDTLRHVLRDLPDNEVTFYGPVASHRIELALLARDLDALENLVKNPRAFVDRGADFLFAPGFLYIAWARQLKGRHDAARAAFLNAREILDSTVRQLPEDWRVHAALGLAEAGLGNRVGARSQADWLLTSSTYRNDAFDGPLLAEARAKILAQIGDLNEALAEIERLLAGPSWLSVHTLRLDPGWDPIRDHPSFKALLVKYARS